MAKATYRRARAQTNSLPCVYQGALQARCATCELMAQRSLARQQYYAHPQNSFWKILHAIWPSSPYSESVDSYQNSINWMLGKGLGLWDVYASCERAGRLDAAIRTPLVNDFAALKHRCPELRLIAHNGGESFKHARHIRA